MSTASWMAASASSRRPRSDSRLDRLFSAVARSGRKASGRAAASARRMSTASWMAASASSRRPRADSRLDRLFSDRCEIRQVDIARSALAISVDKSGRDLGRPLA